MIEVWENLEAPNFVMTEDDKVFNTDDLDTAIAVAEECQDGLVLDLLELRIHRPTLNV